MGIGDEDAKIEEIFMKWIPEEIKFYYELTFCIVVSLVEA